MFKYYVLNYDFNAKKVINFNIFQNYLVDEEVEKSVKKYLRCPKKFTYNDYSGNVYYGFEGLCEDIKHIIAWQERSRREYEISVGDLHEEDLDKYERRDCYQQAEMNIEAIVRECIYQYKEYKKNNK